MIVQVGEEYWITYIKHYDVDIEDYKNWLDGEKPTEDNLLDYIHEIGLDPENAFEDNRDYMNSYIDDINEVFEELNNE